MLTLLVILAVAVVLFIAATLATSEQEVLAEVSPDRADLGLPDGPITPADVDGLRFGLTLRGYRMNEVDLALDRVSSALAERDARIAQLEAALAEAIEPAVAAAEAQLAAPAPPPTPEPAPYDGRLEDQPASAPVASAGAAVAEPPVPAAGDVEPEDLDPGVDEVAPPVEQPWSFTRPEPFHSAAAVDLPVAAPAEHADEDLAPAVQPEVESAPLAVTPAQPEPATEPSPAARAEPSEEQPPTEEQAEAAALPETLAQAADSPWASQAVVPDEPNGPADETPAFDSAPAAAPEPPRPATPEAEPAVPEAPQADRQPENPVDELDFPEVSPAEPAAERHDDGPAPRP